MKTTTIIGCSLWLLGCQEAVDQNSAESQSGEELVHESMAAHGGLEAWYGSGLLQFRWKYFMTDRGPEAVVDTLQVFDPATMNIAHEAEGGKIRFGKAGDQYWILPEDAEFEPLPRFWALTPIYFFGLPFVFNDESAKFSRLDQKIEFEGKLYLQVRISFDKSAGDSPDDYYVLLIDPDTKLTRGAYYIVTSSLLDRDKIGPEKFISLDDLQDFGGLKLASAHRTFEMKDGKIGAQIRSTEVSEVQWLKKGTIDLSKVPK